MALPIVAWEQRRGSVPAPQQCSAASPQSIYSGPNSPWTDNPSIPKPGPNGMSHCRLRSLSGFTSPWAFVYTLPVKLEQKNSFVRGLSHIVTEVCRIQTLRLPEGVRFRWIWTRTRWQWTATSVEKEWQRALLRFVSYMWLAKKDRGKLWLDEDGMNGEAFKQLEVSELNFIVLNSLNRHIQISSTKLFPRKVSLLCPRAEKYANELTFFFSPETLLMSWTFH